MAKSAASPPLLPPEVYLPFQGLVVRPQTGLLHSNESMVFVVGSYQARVEW